MPFPAKQRICPSAHPDLCLATILPCGRSGGWDRSIWEERTPSGRSWRASLPTSSCCSEKPSTRGAAAMRSVPARSPRPRGLSAGPEVPGLRRPQRLKGRLRKLLPKGRELRFDRLAPAEPELAMSHVDRRAGTVRLSLGSGAEGLAKHGPGPVIPTVPSTGETTARGRLARSRAVRLGAETRYPFKVLAGAENQPTKTKAFVYSDREKTRPRVIS